MGAADGSRLRGRERAEAGRYNGPMFAEAAALFGTVLLPILLLVGLGALIQRFQPINLRDLARWQIYLFVPAFMFDRVVSSTLSWKAMAGIAGTILLVKALLGVAVYGFLTWRKVPRRTVATVMLASVIFNAGNFGIPVAERAFGPKGGAVEALVVMVANLSLWGIGYALSAAINGGGMQGLKAYLKLPMVYLLILALGLRALGWRLPEPVTYAVHLLAEGLVPLALVTLGAQLVRQGRKPNWRLLTPVLILKLVALPAVAAVVVWALGLWPWPGAQLIVAAAGPTAVNTMLLAMEQDSDVELAADCVFWTTLFAGISVTLVLAAVRFAGGAPPP